MSPSLVMVDTTSDLHLQVADEAAAVLIEVVQIYSSDWAVDTWQVAFLGPLSYLFELPKSQLAADEDESAVVR